MITIFLGEQNSGKTLSMTYFLYRYYLRGYKIYSNYNLMFKHEKITKDMLIDYTLNKKQFDKSVIAIDELYLFIDARNFGKGFNKIFSYFLLQTSKRNVHLFGTAQYLNTIEKRFRENLNIMVFCSRVLFNPELRVYEKINSNIRIIESRKLYIKLNTMFKKSIDILSNDFLTKVYYLKAQPIFKLYDTKELLEIE